MPRRQAAAFDAEMLAALALPALAQVECRRIEASIREHGVLVPVVVSAGPARAGEVADGRLRQQICDGLGWECPHVERPFATEVEFCLYRFATNVDRRQLTAAQLVHLGLALEPYQRELAAARKAQARGGARGAKTLPVALPDQKGDSRDLVGRLVGLSGASYERGANVIRHGSPGLVAALEAGRETINSAHRRLQAEQRSSQKRQLAEQLEEQPPPLPTGRFDVVVIDAPWPQASLPYPTMTLDEIAALPMPDLLADDAIVWVWTTNRFHYDAERIARTSWQLSHRNTLTWAKTDRHGQPRPGTGQWLRGETEHCLLYTHGAPLFLAHNYSTLLTAPARQHSRKPDAFFELVEATCPGSKLELFAREHRPGWAAWGAETGKFASQADGEEEAA